MQDQTNQFSEQDFGGIFDVNEDSYSTQEQSTYEKDPDMYSVRLDNPNCQDKKYTARLRFVPNPNDPIQQIVKKWMYFLPTPGDVNGKKMVVDCPSNMGPSGKNNIITNAFFALKDHDNFAYRSLAKKCFSRKEYFYTLIQVMIDAQQQDLENTFKIFRFGKSVMEIIDNEVKNDDKIGKIGVKISHPFKGKDFFLRVEEQKTENGDVIPSYTRSTFDTQISSISFDGGKTRLAETQENMAIIYKNLKDGVPDLSRMYHKPWDEQMELRVIESVKSAIGDSTIFDKIFEKTYGTPAQRSKHFTNQISKEDVAKEQAAFAPQSQPIAPAPQTGTAPASQVVTTPQSSAPASQPEAAAPVVASTPQPAPVATDFNTLKQEVQAQPEETKIAESAPSASVTPDDLSSEFNFDFETN